MNLPDKCKRFSKWLFKSQKKSDFSALPGHNAKKSLEEILLEIANSLQLRIVLSPSNPKETHTNSGMRDSNSRPLGPKPSALAIWANPR